MKNWKMKTVCALAGLVMLGSCAALAEDGDKDYSELFPQSMVYDSVWIADGVKLDAVCEDGGFRVSVIRQNLDDRTTWEYSPLYDAEAGTLVDVGSGLKTYEKLDENGEVTETKVEYEAGSATFTLNENGTLTWNDGMEDAGKGLAFVKFGRFEGRYVCDRASIEILWNYEDAYEVRIHWADSAYVDYEWMMTGIYNAEKNTLEALGMETRTEYGENGDILSVTDVTPEGCEAVFCFNENGNLLWTGTEGVNTDGMEFEYSFIGG